LTFCLEQPAFDSQPDVSFFGRQTDSLLFEVIDCADNRTIFQDRTSPIPASEAEELSERAVIAWSNDSRVVRVAAGPRTLWEYEITAHTNE
jgi:hypothetical protein